ncbi:DUF350 domain-containing protein [Tomitella gaofuii]|uniref:DUF350 domain-containing protein n=1 Tax=Tomitella gaofuii TaxID=2760083 RepID=UPI0015F88EBA|nr:DUF350 domain-containing protein [Tomitella gaofuii]
MNLAVEFGTLHSSSLAQNAVAIVLYFAVGVAIMGLGFVLVDVLTPGNLRKQVFQEHRPNAVAVAVGMHLALAIVVASSIFASSLGLAQGLVDTIVYGVIGVLLQVATLIVLEVAAPGRARDLIKSPTLHPSAIAVAVTLFAVGIVNAAAIS